MGFARNITLADVAGGLYERSLRRAAKGNERALAILDERFRESNIWVLLDFGVSDYVDIYRLEAYAYEYWLTTARLRRIGKGGSLVVPEDGSFHTGRGINNDLEGLIQSYDERTAAGGLSASALGVAFTMRTPRGADPAPGVMAGYNTERRPWSEVCTIDSAIDGNFVPNFYLTGIDLGGFYRAHEFAKSSFAAARGFSLLSFIGVVAGLGLLELGTVLHQTNATDRTQRLLHLYQRAYVISHWTGYVDALTETVEYLVGPLREAGDPSLASEVPKVIQDLTLSQEKRRGSGFWSLGPRYPFVHYADGILVDLQGLPVLLRNAFFGIRLDGGPKGTEFEDFFREYSKREGLDLLPERTLKARSGKSREVDAAFRCKDSLILCECRAMETPLDLEISRPKSLNARIDDLTDKVEQARTLTEFVRDNISGENYDFSWASSIEYLVVSPFVEWVWSRDPSLWLDVTTPRILSFGEAVAYLGRESER